MDSNRRLVSHRVPNPDGLDLSVREWGAEGGTAVVFLHGGGQTGWAWESTARRVAASGHRTLALDFRGHGDSDWSATRDYDLDHFVSDLMSVIDHLELDRPVLVGASLGGATALVAAGEVAPERFSGLVLVDITPSWESEGVQRIFEFLEAHPEGFDSLEAAAEAIAAYLPHRRRRTASEGLKKNLRRHDDGRWRWHWDPNMLDRARDARSWQARLAKAAPGVQAPALLVSGGLSDVVSTRTISEFLDLVPHARHVCIADAHHMVAGDRNDPFTHAILEFLGIEPRTLAQEAS